MHWFTLSDLMQIEQLQAERSSQFAYNKLKGAWKEFIFTPTQC